MFGAVTNYGLAIGTTLAVLAGGFFLLPDASEYIFPVEIGTAIVTLYTWLYSFNNIFPVDTLIAVVAYTLAFEVIINFLMPVVFYLMAQFNR